ncbi:WXG100 family type VII secretion target [Conexibacter sp. W3-3-2]|uniref:ESAT-6-like protein n=1 Tax=Paraconexibacter algicola TaxID=2133960 RepID=A0A2T4UH92_9ACTN|nr:MULTISPECIES: WXG100 family type VII secretion target [Solirubrobacterales]MTD44827.1 WXG100 family type VII secretion target [Conexibacter sp. W3-3-2]PTL58569.1 hypothetical protein C7Y72_02290 [Paraconexibacter algicola]
MAHIKVTPEILGNGSTFFRNAAQFVDEAKQDAVRAVGNLDGMWDGTASDGFKSRFNQHVKEVEEARQFFEQISVDLKQAQQRYASAESTVRSIVSS